MASTYTLISSNVLSTSAASVTFSSIPSTYTDLVLRISTRNTSTNNTVLVNFNSSSANFSTTKMVGTGSGTGTSARDGANYLADASASGDTSSTFGSLEIYIPNYAGSSNKPSGTFSVTENNAAGAYIVARANLWSNTAAITSIDISMYGGNLAQYSSFYLYGIKNS